MTDDTKRPAELQSLLRAESDHDGWLPEGLGAPSKNVSLRLLRIRDAADSLATMAKDAKTELPDEFIRAALELQSATHGCLDALHREWLAHMEVLIERVFDRVSQRVLGLRLCEPDGASEDPGIIH